MYDTFYTPFKKGILPEYMYYLGCLVQENPFIDPDYIEGLRTTKDKVKKRAFAKKVIGSMTTTPMRFVLTMRLQPFLIICYQ